MKKQLILTLLFILIFFSVSSLAQTTTFNNLGGTCTPYDDFSTGTLDLNKWQELPGSNINSNFLDEHFVNPFEGAYHTAHLTPSDAGVRLNLLQHQFLPGESLEYDLNYQDASGNRLHTIDVNGQNGIQFGLNGFWNGGGGFCAGDVFGAHHFRITFTQQGVDVRAKLPNGQTVLCPNWGPITGASIYDVAFITRTGNNGIVHMDYDNVRICKPLETKLPSLIGSPTLVSHWKFNEGNGTTAFDETSNHNNGTIQGATWTNDSVSGYALEFDGVGDRIFVGQPSSLNLFNKVKLVAWVKRDSTADGMIVSKNGPYYLAIRGDSVEGGVYVTTGGNHWEFVQGVTDLQLNRWYKISMEYDGIALRVFVDDIEDALLPVSGTMPFTGQDFYMGWGLPGQNQYFDGILDEVKIYGE